MGSDGYQRVTHNNDAVPHLPRPNSMGWMYHHAGDEVWYKNDGADLAYKVCEYEYGKPESPSCANTWNKKGINGIDAHKIYVGKNISNLCTSFIVPTPELFLE